MVINPSKRAWKQGKDKEWLNEEEHHEVPSVWADESPRSSTTQERNVTGTGTNTAVCVTYHVSTDGLGHHAPNRSFGASCCRNSRRGRWDQDWWDGGLWRRRSWSWRRGDMNGSWYWWWDGWRSFGSAHRRSRFGLWSWHHFADDSVGPKMRVVKSWWENNNQSLTRHKENTVRLIHITLASAKRLFQPNARSVALLHPSIGQDKAESHYKVNTRPVWTTL